VLISDPFTAIGKLKEKFLFKDLRLLNYFDAFEKVFEHHPTADIKLSPQTINYKKISKIPGVLSKFDDIKVNYSTITKNKYKVNGHIIKAYYFLNILHAYVNIKRPLTILEIGGGNGNLLTLLKGSSNNSTIIDVDLPETLSHAIPFIYDLFPNENILLPHEANDNSLQNLEKYSFVFLTPKQINLIKSRSIDLAINIASFQEMKQVEINKYFELINRCSKHNSYFFCSNRVEKYPNSFSHDDEITEPVNHFFNYPWNPSNKIILFEISRLSRLVNLDSGFIRLEQIN